MGLFFRRKAAGDIETLKKKAEHFESKIKNLTEILSDLESDIDSLNISSNSFYKPGVSGQSDDDEKVIFVVDDTGDEKGSDQSQELIKDEGKCLNSYLNVDMSGGKEEESSLSIGWWPSAGKFRWSGKDSKYGTIIFTLPEAKLCMLNTRFFVPKYIASKHIRIVANGNEVLDFVSSGGQTIEKKLKIPVKFLKKGRNSIIFKAGFWSPKNVDPKHKDGSIRSLAFDFIRLDEIQETEP